MPLALKEIYAGEHNPPTDRFSYLGRIGHTSRHTPDVAHEFVMADELRGTFSSQPTTLKNGDWPGDLTNFEMLTQGDRRRTARITMRVPLVVIFDRGGWREFTESVDISDTGLKLQLGYPIPENASLWVLIDKAKWPAQIAGLSARSATSAIVRHCVIEPGKPILVGVELDITHKTIWVEQPAGNKI